MPDTVKLNISIYISTEGEADTGLTVEDWNALTDAQRSDIARGNWEIEASNADSGGMEVITAGAQGI